MAINSYSTLCDAVGRWLYRDDLAATIPDFVALAESRINRDLALRAMETSATGTLTGSSFTAPSDLSKAQRLCIAADSQIVELRYVPPETISKYSASTGLPQMYTMLGGQVQIIPAPDGAYTYTFYYMGSFPSLSSTQTTNWLILNAPDVYLYAALLEATPYLQDDTRVQIWGQAYETAVTALQAADDASTYPVSSPLQMVAE
jgi:hypothetical protein